MWLLVMARIVDPESEDSFCHAVFFYAWGFFVSMPLLGLKENFRPHTNLSLSHVSQTVTVFPGLVVLHGVYD